MGGLRAFAAVCTEVCFADKPDLAAALANDRFPNPAHAAEIRYLLGQQCKPLAPLEADDDDLQSYVI